MLLRRVALESWRIWLQLRCLVVSVAVKGSEQLQEKVISNDLRPSHLPARPQTRRLRGPKARHRGGPPLLICVRVSYPKIWCFLSIEVSM